ncbi:MAG: HAD family hydrolase [Monoglobales bacterium]
MFKGIIFDLDGTLLDTIDTIAYYGNLALSKHGFEAIGTAKYKYFAGNGAKHLVKRMLREVDSADEEVFLNVFKDYTNAYNADTLYKTTVYDGIRELISEVKSKGMKLAVLSNKPHEATVDVVDKFFEKGTFDVCHGGREGVPLKPDPAPAIMVARQLGLKNEECIYVGDTDVDMKTGKGAGFYTVGVLWGFRDRQELEESGADLIINYPLEILDIL